MSLAQPDSKGFEPDPVGDIVPPPVHQSCWAVVSFAFEDAVWCDWIYREFDGTRVPRPLVARPSRQGTPYPERISVSPDPADPQQLESYAETLKVAQHLIIVVSPTSSKVNLLQEHMRIFRAEGGEERIIALVVKGDPASPSAEAGSDADADWLPKWLQYRFRNNRFDPGPACEPLVVDARLGVSSLAEVRAKLCAALLEVPVSQLGELGVMIRSSTAELAMQAKSVSPIIVSMPEPTPLPTLAAIAAPEVEPAPKHSPWPVIFCATAAVLALGFLALWPAKEVPEPPPTPAKPHRLVERQPPTQISEVQPLVAVVPVPSNPDKTSATPAVTVPVVPGPPKNPATTTSVSEPLTTALPVPAASHPATPPPANPPSQEAPAPVGTSGLTLPPAAVGAITPAVPAALTPEAEAAERKRYELASRRDRLVRLAETKVNAGETEEALASFQQAIDTAHELVNRTDGGHDEVIELALLYRRFGNFAAGVNSAAEGRLYYERGKRVLQALKAKGKLPREAFKVLADLETATKNGRE